MSETKDGRREFLAKNLGDQGAVMRVYDEVLRERDAALKSVDAAVASRPIPETVRRSILMARDAEWIAAVKGGSVGDWEERLHRGGLLDQSEVRHFIASAMEDKAVATPPAATSRERLVNFLYLLLRDELAAGVVETIAHRTEGIPAEVAVTYSNPHVEGYARELTARLVP